MTPGDTIKSIRLELGMSQSQFGTLIGVARHHVSRWEHNVKNPWQEGNSSQRTNALKLDWLISNRDKLSPEKVKGKRLEIRHTIRLV